MTDCKLRYIPMGLLMDEVRQMCEEYWKENRLCVDNTPEGAFLVMYTNQAEIMCTFRTSIRSAQRKARELIRNRSGMFDATYFRWFILGPDRIREYEFDRG